MKSYCTQNNGDCETCSLSNYGMNCRNKPIVRAFNVRLLPSTIDKISEIAKRQKRTVQAVIEIMVEETFNKL